MGRDARNEGAFYPPAIKVGRAEGLAVLTVGIRLAAVAGLDHLAMNLYRWAAKCLLVQGTFFWERGVAQSLAEYLETVLLPACCRDPMLGSFRAADYLSSIAVLNRVLDSATNAKEGPLTRAEEIDSILRIMCVIA